jgi:hypothetical protein
LTSARYLLGWLWLAAAIAPLAWGAMRLRARCWPGFAGAQATLADGIVVLAELLLICELMGTLSTYRALPVLGATVVCGLVCALVAGKPAAGGRGPAIARQTGGETVGAPIAVACVAVGQIPPALEALRGGISNFDSLEYHLTTPARWYQEASLNGLHHIYPGSLFPYYPSNSELLHGIGMLAFSSDVLSPVVNVGFIAMAFLAAWSIGEARGAGPAAVAALGSLLATLQFAQDGAGTALNDLPQAAFVLTAVALAAHARGRSREVVVIGVAGGLAVGTKPTAALAAACIVGAAVFGVPRTDRARAAAAAILGLSVGGGFWYLRDIVWIGTPIPGVNLGPVQTPSAEQLQHSTFADAVRAGGEPLSLLAGGLHRAFGPAWLLLAALVMAGLVLSLGRSRAVWERGAGLAGLATLVAWPFTPFTFIVDFAIRYAVAGLALGVVLLAVAPPLALGRFRWLMPWLFACLALAALVHVDPFHRSYPGVAVTGGLVVLATLGLAYLRPNRSWLRIGAGVLAGAAVLVSVPVATAYDRNRYTEARYTYSGPAAAALKRLFQWGREIDGERIGIDGGELQYPLYGARLRNHVQYVGVERKDGGFGRIGSCPEWRAAVNAGRYRYVVTVPWGLESDSPPLPSPQAGWTASDPAAEVALDAGAGITVFRIVDRLNPRACPPDQREPPATSPVP